MHSCEACSRRRALQPEFGAGWLAAHPDNRQQLAVSSSPAAVQQPQCAAAVQGKSGRHGSAAPLPPHNQPHVDTQLRKKMRA